MGFKNKNAQNHVQDWVVQGVANLPDINNPQEGDQAMVLDTCDTYIYKSATWQLYISSTGSGTVEWLDLVDTPSSYTGQAGKKVVVKGTEDGLEFSLASTDDQTAAEVPYTNTTSGLAATDTQAAIDEIEARVDTNDAKVSADGSIDTHSDVDTTTSAPSTGEVLKWNGTNWAPAADTAGSGDVVGPASATDNVVAVYDGATGKLIKEAGAGVKVQSDGALNLPIFTSARAGDVAGDTWIEDVAGVREIVVNIAGSQYRVEVSG